jgi:hypothetical protein
MMIRKHYVTFYSPGTFFAETTTREIAEWSPALACAMATEVKERYGARPYGFQFETRACAPDAPDGSGGVIPGAQKKMSESPRYFIAGRVETLADVEARATPDDEILLSNMRCNRWGRIITTTNGYRATQPFETGSINVDSDGNVLEIAP